MRTKGKCRVLLITPWIAPHLQPLPAPFQEPMHKTYGSEDTAAKIFLQGWMFGLHGFKDPTSFCLSHNEAAKNGDKKYYIW